MAPQKNSSDEPDDLEHITDDSMDEARRIRALELQYAILITQFRDVSRKVREFDTILVDQNSGFIVQLDRLRNESKSRNRYLAVIWSSIIGIISSIVTAWLVLKFGIGP